MLDRCGKLCYTVSMIREEVEMHIVEVIGGNKTQRKIAENVVFYMIKKLMPRLRNIEIEVQLKKMNEENAVGYCMMQDNRREYEIEVSKDLSIKDFVMTLCHEMVHVKQYVRNEMDDWMEDGDDQMDDWSGDQKEGGKGSGSSYSVSISKDWDYSRISKSDKGAKNGKSNKKKR